MINFVEFVIGRDNNTSMGEQTRRIYRIERILDEKQFVIYKKLNEDYDTIGTAKNMWNAIDVVFQHEQEVDIANKPR